MRHRDILDLPPAGEDGFTQAPAVSAIAERASRYLSIGMAVHFRGPAGTGKTTLALQLAKRLERPVALIGGDDALSPRDLIGDVQGHRTRQTVDHYISSVLKTESERTAVWVDEIVTRACMEGYTLVYDEFTRSRPETNNVFLSALEERLLVLPAAARGERYLRVHPDFRLILTSNPADYAGVHETQDALFDRILTIDLDYPDRMSEIAIVRDRTGLNTEDAARIVDLVGDFRASGAYLQVPSLRASLMIGEAARKLGLSVSSRDPQFVDLVIDVLASKMPWDGGTGADKTHFRASLAGLVQSICDDREVATVQALLPSTLSAALPERETKPPETLDDHMEVRHAAG